MPLTLNMTWKVYWCCSAFLPPINCVRYVQAGQGRMCPCFSLEFPGASHNQRSAFKRDGGGVTLRISPFPCSIASNRERNELTLCATPSTIKYPEGFTASPTK